MARKWVFPILRLVIFTAIAAALVKLAFFDGTAGGTDPAMPTGQITDPETSVSIGTIRNDVVLDGTVNVDSSVVVKATLTGEVRELLVTPGAAVAKDTPVLRIRAEIPTETGSTVKWETVVAGAAGTLSLPALVGQQVSVGDELGRVVRASFNVTASMPPEQQYRLLNKPTEAEIAIAGGPAPFTCTALTISAGTADESGATTSVRCAVPSDVTVFAGLSAKMTISGGDAEDVLVVPVTAVEGTSGVGAVYLPSPDGGEPVRQEVTLGINDGEMVEITGGIDEGDMVLQFVPGAPADQGVDGMPLPSDGVIIEGK